MSDNSDKLVEAVSQFLARDPNKPAFAREEVEEVEELEKKKMAKEEVEPIEEISKEKTQKYLDRALGDHTHQNIARRNTSGDAQKEFARKEKLRKQGISRAVDRLTAMKRGAK